MICVVRRRATHFCAVATSTRNRVAAGVPSGGEFSSHRRPEADIDLGALSAPAATSADTGADCGTCGRATKRRSGLCRRCDPAAKRNRDDAGGPSRPSMTSGVSTQRSDGPVLDRDADPIPVEEIGQCDFGAVPVVRRGLIVEGQTRTCKNAVRIPPGGGATRCHKHGGDPSMSLGRTVAKARAEAGRGECFPLAPEHWDQQEQRLEAAQGRLLQILDRQLPARGRRPLRQWVEGIWLRLGGLAVATTVALPDAQAYLRGGQGDAAAVEAAIERWLAGGVRDPG